ncbi:hypothetical protein CHELA20_11111 [Hyphomicrobiales bacterium]|nr:hypothetical protein CHELA20_11111 [Hyphomicrobiales bacterium]CAH1694927.1 hypothetical protein CHELA41_51342 [Hyphomicrobiales bacterium]
MRIRHEQRLRSSSSSSRGAAPLDRDAHAPPALLGPRAPLNRLRGAPTRLEQLTAPAGSLLRAGTSPNTRRAYAADWSHFCARARRPDREILTPNPQIVGARIAARASGVATSGGMTSSASTIGRRLSALAWSYAQRGPLVIATPATSPLSRGRSHHQRSPSPGRRKLSCRESSYSRPSGLTCPVTALETWRGLTRTAHGPSLPPHDRRGQGRWPRSPDGSAGRSACQASRACRRRARRHHRAGTRKTHSRVIHCVPSLSIRQGMTQRYVLRLPGHTTPNPHEATGSPSETLKGKPPPNDRPPKQAKTGHRRRTACGARTQRSGSPR